MSDHIAYLSDIADISMDSTEMTVDGSWKYIHPPFTKESMPLNLELTWKLEAPQGEIIMYYVSDVTIDVNRLASDV